jgi:hypothetical protein
MKKIMPVTVKGIRQAGALVRIDLSRAGTDEFLEADLPRETADRLKPVTGERLYLWPRRIRVFESDPPYSSACGPATTAPTS